MGITYNSTPDGLLTYASPSPKLCLQSSGSYAYQPHNLYLNSAAPANQSITVVSGATYEIIITGSVSITWSGAYTGTTTAGTQAFTAATGTLTGGSTSGSGTVSVRRTPSANTYVATTGSAVYRLPYEWSTSGTALGIRVEPAATNLVVNNTTLTTGWTLEGSTTRTAGISDPLGGTGAYRLSNMAGTSSYFYRNVGTTAVAQIQSWFVRGTNGQTTGLIAFDGTNLNLKTINLTGQWQRVDNAFTSTDVNIAQFGIGNISNGYTADVIDVFLPQLETGSVATSPIETFGSTVTRADDVISLPTTAFPFSATTGTIYVNYVPTNVSETSVQPLCLFSDFNNVIAIQRNTTTNRGLIIVSASTLATGNVTTMTAGTAAKVAMAYASGSQNIAGNGTSGTSASSALPSGVSSLYLGNYGGIAIGNMWLQEVGYFPRQFTPPELQALTS